MMTVGFTAIESVPGVRLQHICPMLRDAAARETLALNIAWKAHVTGQGLGDVVHTVHLQIGLICTRKQSEAQSEQEKMQGRGKEYILSILMMNKCEISCWKENIMRIFCVTAIINLYRR